MTYSGTFKVFGQSTSNDNNSYKNTVLAGATGASTVSGTVNLFPTSATTAVSVTLKPNYYYKIATKSNGIMYAFGHSSWDKAGHKASYLPPDSWETEWCPLGLNTLSVTLVSGESTGTDVYVTQKLAVDLPYDNLLPVGVKLIGQ